MTQTNSAMIGYSAGANNTAGVRRARNTARSLLNAVLFVFVVDTLFDPADLLFGLKLPLYLMCWMGGFLVCWTRRESMTISMELVMYCLAMIMLPLISILLYQIMEGKDRFEGFQLLKAYLFISMAVLLYVTRTNILPHLAAALTMLAGAVFAVTALVLLVPGMLAPAYAFGEFFSIFSIDSRDYGGGLVMFQMYFKTSSMLVVSAAYYFHKAWFSRSRKKMYWFLCVFSLLAMVVAGTRNNVFVAFLLPLLLTFLYAKRKMMVVGVLASVSMIAIILMFDKIAILFNPVEKSNRLKLDMLGDYAAIFSSPSNLWLGRGLGAYEKWSHAFNYITELTYLEIVRNYGLVMGLMLMCLLVFPLVYAFLLRRSYPEKNIVIAYATYLLMSATNPLFFSSTGMLILSAVVTNIFFYESSVRGGSGGS